MKYQPTVPMKTMSLTVAMLQQGVCVNLVIAVKIMQTSLVWAAAQGLCRADHDPPLAMVLWRAGPTSPKLQHTGKWSLHLD